MANPFLDYIRLKINADPSLLSAEKSGSRTRIFDQFTLEKDQLGKEALIFINQASSHYTSRTFIPPYTKKNVDTTHQLYMQLNKDLEETAEWDNFWQELKASYNLEDNMVAILKLHFISAYRFKIISLFSTTLQTLYPNEKLNIIMGEGQFLQTLNTLMKDDAQRRHLTADELLNAIYRDLSVSLKTSLGQEENFNVFYTPKNANLIQNLGMEGFKIVFAHFNNDNTTLTHKQQDFAKLDNIRAFLRLFQTAAQESAKMDEEIKSDPEALFFIRKAAKLFKKQNDKQDKLLIKFLKPLSDFAKAKAKTLLIDLKKIKKEMEGSLKEELSSFLKYIEANAKFPDVSYTVMSDILNRLATLKGHATITHFVKNSNAIEKLISICDTYLGSKKSSSPASSSIMSPAYPAAMAAMSPLADPMLFQSRLSTPPPPPLQDPKDNLAHLLTEKAKQILNPEDSSRELTKNEKEVANLIAETAKQITTSDTQGVYKMITELKLAIIQVLAVSAGVSKESNLENINEEIDAFYAQFIKEKAQPPKLS